MIYDLHFTFNRIKLVELIEQIKDEFDFIQFKKLKKLSFTALEPSSVHFCLG